VGGVSQPNFDGYEAEYDVQGVAAPIEDPVPDLPALPHPRLATRQRLTQQQIWVAQHIDLIKQAVSSTTRG